jgi:hypothetical protein
MYVKNSLKNCQIINYGMKSHGAHILNDPEAGYFLEFKPVSFSWLSPQVG